MTLGLRAILVPDTIARSQKVCRPIGLGVENLWAWGKGADILIAMSTHARPSPRLRLRAGESEIFVDLGRPAVRLGREPHNDLVVEGTGVSRSHARIELRHGRFVLIDESTNGTLLITEGKPSREVRRQEVQLVERGTIVLGGQTDDAVGLDSVVADITRTNAVDYQVLQTSP
jgi:pSer/pThr/pTyr-binding forkhead associated (FHA) protein